MTDIDVNIYTLTGVLIRLFALELGWKKLFKRKNSHDEERTLIRCVFTLTELIL